MSAMKNRSNAESPVHSLNRTSAGAAVLIHLAAAGLAGFLLTAPADAKLLEPRALKALFPGTFEAVVQGYTVSFTAHEDGSLVGRYATATDTGRWSIRKGRLCIMLSSWLSGRTTCSRVVQNGQWYQADTVVFRKP